MEIACGVGTPLQLDRATRDGLFGHYARVLVEVDSSDIPTSILVEREGYSFLIGIHFENLPPQCDTCGLLGHQPSQRRRNNESAMT